MYNLLECSNKYYMAPGSLWSCYRDEVDVNDVLDGKSQKYKTKITGKRRKGLQNLEIKVIPTDNHKIPPSLIAKYSYTYIY